MNPDFEKFSEQIHLIGNLENWNQNDALELKKMCYIHASKNTSGEAGKENIIAVHLYHKELSSFGRNDLELEAKKRRPAEVKKLEEILRIADRKKYKRILFESFIPYASRAHQLVDEGIIDYVIFTKHNEGTPINEANLIPFYKTKANYIGGTYGHQCVDTAIEEIRKVAPYFSIIPITDAIVFNDIEILEKLMLMASGGGIQFSGRNSTSDLFILPKIYSLIKGVKSDKLIA
jgi:hypothetical protein